MTSIYSLPPEILAEIATFLAHEQGQPAIALLTVCRRWKEAIYASPPAWSVLSIRCSSEMGDAVLQVIESWLTRSVQSPLFVVLDLEDADARPIQVLSLSAPLIQNRDRIRELHITRASSWNLWSLDTLWPALDLSSLHITYEEAPSYAQFLELLELPFFLRNTPQAPRLRRLRLHHCLLEALTCPPEGLVELDISSSQVSLRGLRQMLWSFPDLRRLSLGPEVKFHVKEEEKKAMYTERSADGSIKRLNLPNLHSLELYSDPTSLSLLLHNFGTPSLTHLKLVVYESSAFPLMMLWNFLDQKDMPIYSLDLTFTTPTERAELELPVLEHMRKFRLTGEKIKYDPTQLIGYTSLVEFIIKLEPTPPSIAPLIQELEDAKCFDIKYTREGERTLLEGQRSAT
ncbi:hypothetical protein CPB86DRAFT_747249 [Serendipita vermifera]|nr:hypothetical protein CPB86DRAFT_747249 [Serendipita vermifera]